MLARAQSTARAQSISRRSHSNLPARGARQRLAAYRPSVEALEVRVLLASSIGGTVVEDLTGDGVSAGDVAVPGRVVRLFRDNGDGVLGAGDAPAGIDTTRANGAYAFRSLSAGTYFVQQALPAGWAQTSPTEDEHDEVTTPDQAGPTPKERNDTLATAIATELNSSTPGRYVARGEIGDNSFKAQDVDLYKVQVSAGDRLVADIDATAFGSPLDSILRVFDATGRPLAADDDAITGGVDSRVEWVATSTGAYYVGVSCFINGGYNPLVEGSGGFGSETGEYTIEIGVGPRSAQPAKVTVADGVARGGVDLASSRTGAITGQMFVDVDGDGQHDPGEPGMDGQEIVLNYRGTFFGFDATRSIDLDGNGRIDPATESGWYSFEGLLPGIYFVRNLFPFGVGIPGFEQVSPEMDFSARPFVGQVTAGPGSDPGPGLEPDLSVDLANGLSDWFQTGDTLYFAQATPNIGLGPMELRGGADLGNGTQVVNQRIYLDNSLTTYVERQAGVFTYHPEHGHIHFLDYTTSSIRQALPDGNGDGLPDVGAVVAGGEKTSFCLLDSAPYDLSLPNAAQEPSGFGCGIAQRISVGWEDIYDALTPGQQIDVGGLAPGQYWLEANVDPENHLVESNESNNVGRVLVSIGLGTGPEAPTGAHGVTLSSGQVAAAKDFAVFQLISIGGQVFNDQNSNGRQDNKEHGLDGSIVFLDVNGDGVLNNPEGDGLPTALADEPWTITDNQGNYQFAGVGTGSYPVRLVPRAGWTQTTPNPAPIAARSGQNVAGVSFGLFNSTGAVTASATDAASGKQAAGGGSGTTGGSILFDDAGAKSTGKRPRDMLSCGCA